MLRRVPLELASLPNFAYLLFGPLGLMKLEAPCPCSPGDSGFPLPPEGAPLLVVELDEELLDEPPQAVSRMARMIAERAAASAHP